MVDGQQRLALALIEQCAKWLAPGEGVLLVSVELAKDEAATCSAPGEVDPEGPPSVLRVGERKLQAGVCVPKADHVCPGN